MSSPNKKRKNCTRYRSSIKAGTRGSNNKNKGSWKKSIQDGKKRR